MKTKLLFILFSISICCYAQKQTLTGIVYDEEKNVLADANVMVKNSEKGTITNEKGQFTIDVDGISVLEVSYLGFETKEIVVDPQKELNIVLKSQWEKIDPVVVVAYGSHSCSHRMYCNFLIDDEKATEFKRISSKRRVTSLFPNPSASGMFQLQLNDDFTKLTVEVFNMNGQLLQSNTYSKLSKIPKIDLSKQPKGIYLIRINADGNVLETKKAIRS